MSSNDSQIQTIKEKIKALKRKIINLQKQDKIAILDCNGNPISEGDWIESPPHASDPVAVKVHVAWIDLYSKESYVMSKLNNFGGLAGFHFKTKDVILTGNAKYLLDKPCLR